MSIKYIKIDRNRSNNEFLNEMYSQIKHDFGAVVEPFLIHSLSPKLLGGVWAACRETELITDIVPRNAKELIASTVSQINKCPYCVDAHTIMLNALGENKVAESLSKKGEGNIHDPKLKNLYKWALATRSPKEDIILTPPFSIEEAPEIIGIAVFYHYINKMASMFLSETPLPFNFKFSKMVLKIITGLFFSFSAKRVKNSGDSLKFIQMAELPEELNWAKGSPEISKAFAGLSNIIDNIGNEILSPEVRKYVTEYIQSWNGEYPGMSSKWVDTAINKLDAEQKEIGRLILIASIAPYQINQQMVISFRNIYPEEDSLLGAIAWGSFLVAKRIGTWLFLPFCK